MIYLKCINLRAVLIFAVQFTAKLRTARIIIPREKAKKISNIFRLMSVYIAKILVLSKSK